MVPRVRLTLLCVLLSVCAGSCAPGHAESPEVNGRRYFGSLSFVTARPWFLAVVPQFQRTAATRPVATGFIAFRERRAVGTR